jgi:hypothetical protein
MVVGERYVARFPAVGAVIEAVHAKPDIMHTFADGAVFVAGAVLFGLVALRANNLLTFGRHCASERNFT